jgi:hypothetical protein
MIALKIIIGLLLLVALIYEQKHHIYKQEEGFKGITQWIAYTGIFLVIAVAFLVAVCLIF